MEHDEKIAKLEVNVETQSISIAELRGFNERILTELHKCNTESRLHSDRQTTELRQHTDRQVAELREYAEQKIAEQRKQLDEQSKYHEQQLTSLRKDYDDQNRYREQQLAALRKDYDDQNRYREQQLAALRDRHDEQLAEQRKFNDLAIDDQRNHTNHQVEILRAEAARREDKFDANMRSLRNDMTIGFRWTSGAILTLAGLMVATYTKLLGLY